MHLRAETSRKDKGENRKAADRAASRLGPRTISTDSGNARALKHSTKYYLAALESESLILGVMGYHFRGSGNYAPVLSKVLSSTTTMVLLRTRAYVVAKKRPIS